MRTDHQFTARDLRALIIPLIADSFLSILIGMADTVMVSTCGEAAVSGVSLVDTISNLLITVFSAFATGGAVVVSQYLGHGDGKNARDSAKNLIYISLAISALMTAVILPIRSHIIDLLFGSIDSSVKMYTDEYFVPILLSYPFLAVYSGLTAISRSESEKPPNQQGPEKPRERAETRWTRRTRRTRQTGRLATSATKPARYSQ